MRESSWLAIGVCIACFLIGYLTYLAAGIFVNLLIERAAPCRLAVQACAEQETPHKDR